MARQLVIDLYGCSAAINDVEAVKAIARQAIEYVGAGIVEECVHVFEPVGITYFAVITTSHFSIHTWPEYGYAAVDIFSCSDHVAEGIADLLRDAFGAKEAKIRMLERRIEQQAQV